MPSEVALVYFFWVGYCLMQRHKKYNAQLLVMSKKLRSQPTVSPFFSASTTFSLFKSRFAIFKVFRYA